jgi:carbonic anhydrase
MKLHFFFDKKYLLDELKLLFSPKYLKDDAFAGITVAFIAIPLSLAAAMASSAPPEAGLVSAIIGGCIAALFGGSRLSVTGPAVAMAILIAECVQTHGLSGIIIIGIICGILQILSGLFGLGRFVKLIPIPVIAAFITAIGFIIFIGQLPRAFQLPPPDQHHVFDVVAHIGNYLHVINTSGFMLTLSTITILIILSKLIPQALAIFIAVIVPTFIAYIFKIPGVELINSIPHNLSLSHIINFSQISNWQSLLTNSVALFILCSLDTLLSSSALDKISKDSSYKPNQELIGQGLANIGVALFGGIPVTAVIARSSVNLGSGAKTRRSAIIHSILIFIIVYFFPQFIELIPTTVLAGILLCAALKMMNLRSLINFWHHDKLDVAIYGITFLFIISNGLLGGIQIGIILSFMIVALKLLTTKISVRLSEDKQVLRAAFSGNMTFWSFDKLNELQKQILRESNLKFVIFEFDNLSGIDSTGAQHITDSAREISKHHIKVIFHGLTHEQERFFSANMTLNTTDLPYIATVTENEIKEILEEAGVTHSANDILKHGMANFQNDYAFNRSELLSALAKEQNPHTLLITCSDSRINPNAFFSVDLGEIFIVRNVGNVIPIYDSSNKCSEGAAIEFAINNLGIRNVIVCGHTECGAIKASIKNPHKTIPSSLTNWLQIIKDGFTKHPPKDVDEGVQFSLLNQIEHLKTYPIVQERLQENKLTISAWIYDVHSADMLEWNAKQHRFVHILEKVD